MTGRPRIVSSPEEFDRLVDEYVANCKAEDEPVTFTGMALHLGFCDRRSLYDYQKRDGFSRSVKRARALVEHEYEKKLLRTTQVAGPIFALKNHGWRDRPRDEDPGADVTPSEFARLALEASQQMFATMQGPETVDSGSTEAENDEAGLAQAGETPGGPLTNGVHGRNGSG